MKFPVKCNYIDFWRALRHKDLIAPHSSLLVDRAYGQLLGILVQGYVGYAKRKWRPVIS